jgi:hypothetical protein
MMSIGKHCLIIHETSRYVDVTPFHPSLPNLKGCPIISGALAYDDPETGATHIMVIHQAIYFDHLENNLISPMQLRMNDLSIDECPKFLSPVPSDETHSIHFPRKDLRISLSLHGTIQYFPARKPTPQEYDDCPETHRHEATYEMPNWNQHSLSFNRQEENMTDTFGHLNEPSTRSYNRKIASSIAAPMRNLENINNENSYTRARQNLEYNSQSSAILSDVTNTLNDDQFATDLAKDVKVTYSSIASTSTGPKQAKLTAPELSRKWNIGLEAAKRTLKVTTQRGIRNVTHKNLTRRFPTNDRHFKYRHLNTTLFKDTLIANSPSSRGNKYAQVYCNELEWVRLYPMKKKS